MKTLQDLFVNELSDIYDAEHRIMRALAKLAKSAESPDLQEAFLTHVKETEQDVKKLERVFKSVGLKPRAKKCEGIIGVLGEGDAFVEDFKGTPVLDAALIAAAQKVEHYEMASYGCLQEWAELLGNDEAANLLREILDDEKATDETLTELARASSNEEALGEGEIVASVREEDDKS